MKGLLCTKGRLLVVLCILTASARSSAQTSFVVDQSGGGDYTTIQNALIFTISHPESVVFVNEGTYVERINLIGKAVQLIAQGPGTIIDGNSNGTVIKCISGEKSDTIISGFTVINGTGTLAFGQLRGGGLYADDSNPTVTGCTFRNNSAYYGGGVYMNSGVDEQTISECTFDNNTSSFGGGLYNFYSPSQSISECKFTNNRAEEHGGAIYSFASSGLNPRITDCEFARNSATFQGGAVYNSVCDATITRSLFVNNFAGDRGGGIFSVSGDPTISNCEFRVNRSGSIGGGVYSGYSRTFESKITNCAFVANHAAAEGGGLYVEHSGPLVTNCTFIQNSAPIGGAVRNEDQSFSTIANSVLWRNNGSEISTLAGESDDVSYSIVQGDHPGSNVRDIDPQLIRLPNDGGDGYGDDPATADVDEGANDDLGDLRLASYSPAIDAGNNIRYSAAAASLDSDLGGLPRIIEDPGVPDVGEGCLTCIDVGAHEYQLVGCLIPGDMDDDGAVNDGDNIDFINCLLGPDHGSSCVCADFDNDGNVDVRDYAAFQWRFNKVCVGSGDADGNGVVDLADFAEIGFCLQGPNVSIPPICKCIDFNQNNVGELQDFAVFQRLVDPAQ